MDIFLFFIITAKIFCTGKQVLCRRIKTFLCILQIICCAVIFQINLYTLPVPHIFPGISGLQPEQFRVITDDRLKSILHISRCHGSLRSKTCRQFHSIGIYLSVNRLLLLRQHLVIRIFFRRKCQICSQISGRKYLLQVLCFLIRNFLFLRLDRLKSVLAADVLRNPKLLYRRCHIAVHFSRCSIGQCHTNIAIRIGIFCITADRRPLCYSLRIISVSIQPLCQSIGHIRIQCKYQDTAT